MVKFDLDVEDWGILLGFLDGLIILPERVQEVKDKLDVQYLYEIK